MITCVNWCIYISRTHYYCLKVLTKQENVELLQDSVTTGFGIFIDIPSTYKLFFKMFIIYPSLHSATKNTFFGLIEHRAGVYRRRVLERGWSWHAPVQKHSPGPVVGRTVPGVQGQKRASPRLWHWLLWTNNGLYWKTVSRSLTARFRSLGDPWR